RPSSAARRARWSRSPPRAAPSSSRSWTSRPRRRPPSGVLRTGPAARGRPRSVSGERAGDDGLAGSRAGPNAHDRRAGRRLLGRLELAPRASRARDDVELGGDAGPDTDVHVARAGDEVEGTGRGLGDRELAAPGADARVAANGSEPHV